MTTENENEKCKERLRSTYKNYLISLLHYASCVIKEGTLSKEFRDREDWVKYVNWERHLRVMEELRLGLLFLEREKGGEK